MFSDVYAVLADDEEEMFPLLSERLLDAIDELTRTGILDACGSDFYMLTQRGKGAIAQS